jgi:formiminotetrahydrofolate cyclodeaminase
VESGALLALADRDAAAFDSVMAAHRLPHRTDAERTARDAAVQAALVQATAVPLLIAQRAGDLLPIARELVETGNVNAVSDAYSAAQMLHGAVLGGLANVSINLAARTDAEVDALHGEAGRVRERAAAALAGLETAFEARLTGRH